MINVKPIIYDKLKGISKNVTDVYPSDWATFPVVQYIEEENSTYLKTDDREQLVYVRYKIDIWSNGSTSNIALAVDNALSSLGLRRSQCIDAPDPSQLRHKVMRFEGVIDVNNMRVYNS